jgi:hypothetical protein
MIFPLPFFMFNLHNARMRDGVGAVLVALLAASGGVANAEARAPHPEPRVIVNVISVRGPHERAEVERAARRAWGRIVSCYKTIDQSARGTVELELVVAGTGKVTAARRTRSTLENGELASCLTDAMKGLSMPKAASRSTAKTEIRVAPGDPPAG